MEFLGQNKILTSTSIAVDSSTNTAEFLIDRNISFGWRSAGYAGGTETTIVVSFTSAVVLSHILLQNHNLKEFQIYYDGTTTNSLFSTTTNSATNSYISFASVTVSSVSLKMTTTFDSSEKNVGELVMLERKLVFERNPSIADYKTQIYRKQIVHKMPDGGGIVFNAREKTRVALSWDYVTEDFYDDLFDLYRTGEPLYFIPQPTTTVWDGEAAEVIWTRGFDFKFSSNIKEAGYSGSIEMSQTPSG